MIDIKFFRTFIVLSFAGILAVCGISFLLYCKEYAKVADDPIYTKTYTDFEIYKETPDDVLDCLSGTKYLIVVKDGPQFTISNPKITSENKVEYTKMSNGFSDVYFVEITPEKAKEAGILQ